MLVVVLLGAGATLWPFETVVVPAWTVSVVDREGRPVPDIAVNYSWQHYSLERESHNERTRTDGAGKVSFPERRIRANMLMRVVGPMLNVVSLGVHLALGRLPKL